MTNSNSNFKLGTSVLLLFLLTMSFSISITPLVHAEAVLDNIVLDNTIERLTSLESFDRPSIREFDSPERVTDSSYNYDYDSLFTDTSEWNVEQPEREPYQSEPLIIPPGTPHATILIDSNDDFDTQGWPGDGSIGTPYLIDALEINATAANPGISISGTDVYFVISDCIINGSYEVSTGIVLNSVANALIYNNTCFEGDIGILLNQTDGISVIENQCYAMDRAGIYLDRSDDNTIHDNIVTDNWDGIYLERSNLNYIDENFCAGNQWGIDLYWTSNENDVYNNTVLSNIEFGIILTQECTLNTIELNSLTSNGNFGIFLEESDENIVRRNYSETNGGDILLVETEGNVIDNNTLVNTNGPEGLLLVNTNDTLITNNYLFLIEYAILIVAGSTGVDLIDNNCTFFDYGLVIEDADDILVQDSYFDSLFNSYGIYAFDSTNIDVIDSEFYRTMTLLWIEECVNVDIIGNIGFDYSNGIFNLGSNSSTIKDNVCQMGNLGIVSELTYDTVIHNNTVIDHGVDFGIGVFDSPDVIVTSNNCTDNIQALVAADSEGILIEDNFCYLYENGIDVSYSNHSTITGNHVQEGVTGINVVTSFFVDILDNDVIDNLGPTGIHLTNSESCLVSMNNLTGNEVPSIYLETSHYCNITHNVITDTIDGVVITNSNHTIITDNHITMGQGYGIGVWGSSHNFVSRNHIANISGWEGWALCFSGYYNEFSYNLCDNSTIGIFVDSALDAYIAHNSAHGNDEAIWLTTSSANATVSWNIFEDNIHNGLDDSITSIVDYNFWSNYTGADADSDGIGDTPHPITGLANNNDTHPLVYYPTVPTWLIEPQDQDHEYGHDFEYTVEVLSPTGIAPISEWWIDDSDFDVDDGVITSNVALDLGGYPVEVRVINIYGFYLSGFFIVTVDDTVTPTIVGPDDFNYVVGQIGRLITWIPDDLGPASYSLSLDGVVVMSGAWNSTAENITYTADGLDVGDHTFVLTVTDVGGNSATDTVVVTVVGAVAGGDVTLLLIAVGAGGAIIVVVIIIYLSKKKGTST